jgi:Ca2+-binding RTX toxin-like protein
MVSRIGNDKANQLTGTSLDDLLDGRGGNDVLKGLSGNDTLLGGDGNDSLNGSAGADAMDGQRGNDTLVGGGGDDLLYGRGGSDSLSGGDGDDTLNGGKGTNHLDGDAGNDTFVFGGGADTVIGGDGIDTLSFANATGPVSGDDTGTFTVNDVIQVDAQVENVIGSNYNDSLEGFGFDSTVHGGNGDDVLFSDQPFSFLFGDAGNDTLAGGQNGFVTMDGGAGNDLFFATFASDMTGGPDSDTFNINYQFEDLTGFSSDGSIIRDFEAGKDVIHLSGRDPDAFLTNEGDVWTVHSPNDTAFQEFADDPDAEFTMSFQVVGVTELHEGTDYVIDTALV